jgi:hypothetical protein
VIYLLLILLVLAVQTAGADDEITLRYRQAWIGEVNRFWNGEGYLQSSGGDGGEDFVLNKGTASIQRYTSNLKPVEEDEGRAIFSYNRPGPVEFAFLTGRPEGHGFFYVDEQLPKISDRRHIVIQIENGERILYSNINWTVERGGSYLTLESYTQEEHLRLAYMTRFANMIFSNAIAAILFLGFLLAYMLYRRRETRSRVRAVMDKARKGAFLPFRLESSDEGFRITYLKKKTSTVERSAEPPAGPASPNDTVAPITGPSILIPRWLVSSLLVVILLVLFVQSLFNPLKPVWGQLGALQYAIVLGGLVYALLSMIFISSAASERGQLARVGIVGGGIVWIMFAYLGWIALLLAGSTALLIYLLSVLVLEEDSEASGDDTGL